MKIIILGCTGLLGNTITKNFLQNYDYEIYPIIRDFSKIKFFKQEYHKNFVEILNILDLSELEKTITPIKPDIIINCLGLTNKFSNNNAFEIQEFIEINSLFPHKLYQLCMQLNIRLIHFSSDCIFSGKKGAYSETDIPDPIDIYGKSKLLGELDYENCITIRKSVIGHELFSKNGLLEWFIDQNEVVQGYKKVIFSGLTALELSRLLAIYIIPSKNLKGIINVTGPSITKYDLLKKIARVYKKSINIIPNESVISNRSLNGSKFSNLSGYQPKSWNELINSMYQFNMINK
tara:strand:+ start:130 stop:1002 length:873 start_codon:yes stop_codon:yes gene_type:complete